MPSLDRHPDDALLDTIRDLERQLAEVRTLRKRPSPGCKVSNVGSQNFPAATLTTVTLDNVWFDTAGMADVANDRIAIPSDGIYLAVVYIPPMTGAAQSARWELIENGVSGANDAILYGQADPATSHTSTVVATYIAGWTIALKFRPATHDTANSSASVITLTVERLHDIPAQP